MTDLVKNIAGNISDKLCKMPLASMTAAQEEAIQFAIQGCANIVRMREMEDASKENSLLKHLCSLTVAERETILRTADIASSIMIAARMDHTEGPWMNVGEAIANAISAITESEAQLRGSKPCR